MKRGTLLFLLALNLLLCSAIATLSALFLNSWGFVVTIFCYVFAGISFVFGVVVFALKKEALLKSCFVFSFCVCLVVLILVILTAVADLDGISSNDEKIQKITQIIRDTGKWGMFVYVLIQILQVVLIPLPALLCYIPGTLIWGPLIATILASIGVIIGSVIAYLIGKFVGKKIVVWIAGKEATEKYVKMIGKKSKFVFLIMQVLPFFPDDILCMVAGITSMNFWFYLAVIVIVRPIVIAIYCFLGSGSIIPFSGWGIAVWILIFAVCIVLAILSFKYQNKIENFILKKFSKKKKKQNNQKSEDVNKIN